MESGQADFLTFTLSLREEVDVLSMHCICRLVVGFQSAARILFGQSA